MGSEEEFREEIWQVLKRHDPSAEDLRDLACDLEATAERYEELEAMV
jgi:hypothetical protein